METYVVGVDLSPASVDALHWALGHAASRSARVVAVHAFDYLRQVDDHGEATFDPNYSREQAEAKLMALVERMPATDAEAAVQVDVEVVVSRPAEAVLDAIGRADADLAVVGSRGTGGFRGLLMGSVSQQVAMHAPCPVVVHRAATSWSSDGGGGQTG